MLYMCQKDMTMGKMYCATYFRPTFVYYLDFISVKKGLFMPLGASTFLANILSKDFVNKFEIQAISNACPAHRFILFKHTKWI